jgi:c-di-GMP-binding flagellar brake protein YcgR
MFGRTVSKWRRLLHAEPEAVDGEVAQAVQEDRRVWVRYPADLETTYQPVSESDSRRLSARVRNISLNGINLLVNRPFTPGDLLSVELPRAGDSSPYTVLACVVHASPHGEGEWAVGCTFSRELGDEDLQTFGARRIKPAGPDQRTWQRFTTSLKASYQIITVAEPRPCPAQVLNVSATGIGLVVTQPVQVGTVLSLELHGNNDAARRTMLACVVHATERGTGEWALGCNFIRSLSEEDLHSLV